MNALGRPSGWLSSDRLRMGGVKIYGDGALGSRGARLKQPYADMPGSTGLQFLSDSELQAQVDRATAKGFQVAVHAIGDAANAQVISAFETAGKRIPATAAGGSSMRRSSIRSTFRASPPAGIIASMQPTHQTSDRTMAEKRLDPPRLQGAYAWRSMLQSGARLAFGSDVPVESPNPFPGIGAAISRAGLPAASRPAAGTRRRK